MVITRSGLHPEAQVLSSDANTDLNVHTEAAAWGSYTTAQGNIIHLVSSHPRRCLRFRRLIWSFRFPFGSGLGDGRAMSSRQRVATRR